MKYIFVVVVREKSVKPKADFFKTTKIGKPLAR